MVNCLFNGGNNVIDLSLPLCVALVSSSLFHFGLKYGVVSLCCCKKYLLIIRVVVGTTGVSNAGLDVLVLVEALECLFNTPMNSNCERK